MFLGKLKFQKRFGAFTHSRSQIDIVVKYILTQEDHHKKTLFREEYEELLVNNKVEFNQEYLFDYFGDIYSWD